MSYKEAELNRLGSLAVQLSLCWTQNLSAKELQ